MAGAAVPRATERGSSPRSSRSSTRPRARAASCSTSPDWPGHRAGQHVDVRLTAEDGYQAQRSYSIASAPEDDAARAHGRAARRRRGLAVPDRGAATGRRARAARPDRRLLRLGATRSAARCCWSPAARASCRCGRCCATARPRAATVPVRLLYSARTLGRRDLPRRARPARRRRRRPLHADPRAAARAGPATRGRVDADDARARSRGRRSERPLVYVCGPTGFVEAVADALVELGHEPGRIRTERFGATGADGRASSTATRSRGVLQEVFGAEVTAARDRCAGCGATRPVGELVAYIGGPGTVDPLPLVRHGDDGRRHRPRPVVRRPARARRDRPPPVAVAARRLVPGARPVPGGASPGRARRDRDAVAVRDRRRR